MSLKRLALVGGAQLLDFQQATAHAAVAFRFLLGQALLGRAAPVGFWFMFNGLPPAMYMHM